MFPLMILYKTVMVGNFVIGLGIAGSWHLVLCIRGDSCGVSWFHILRRAGDKGPHSRGDRGKLPLGIVVVLRSFCN